jgi:hypothetical protein
VEHASASLYSGFTVGRQFQYVGKFCFSYQPSLQELAGVCCNAVREVRRGDDG